MPSLKDLRLRIASVKSTRKITSAMKMVAGAKLRRAQDQAEAARPYAELMDRLIASLARSVVGQAPPLMSGNGKDQAHLIIVATSDRGLCGAFNSTIVRDARQLIAKLLSQGKTVKVICVGRKGRDNLRRDYARLIIDSMELGNQKSVSFALAVSIADKARAMFEAGEIDVATIIFSRFRSAISQVVTRHQLIPVAIPETAATAANAGPSAVYEYEPDEEAILSTVLPRNLSVQVFRALLENNASEQGSRMTAMDNATRNAGDMITKLTLNYNRTRQAVITKELIEIISGAEAV